MSSESQLSCKGMSSPAPLLSVIVPVYRVEPYLRQALDSLLAQTYPNIEIICVDDGSPDACPAILDEYAAKHPRIKVIHQQNQGLSGARNSGINAARGEFIAFMDSDDSVFPDTYEKAMAHMTEGIDMVQFGVEVVPDDPSQQARGEQEKRNHNQIYAALLREQGDGSLSMGTRAAMNTTVYSCDKLYRRSLMEQYQLRFPLGYYTEDSYFVRCYQAVASKMYFVDALLYRYRLVGGSLSTVGRSQDARALVCLDTFDLVFQFYARRGFWEKLVLIMPWLLYSLDLFKGNLPEELLSEGEQRVRDIRQQWRAVVEASCPWDDRLQHLLGLHGWASLRHEWRNARRCPKDRRRLLPGVNVFSRPGLEKLFICGLPVITLVDVGGRRFLKVFGMTVRKMPIRP